MNAKERKCIQEKSMRMTHLSACYRVCAFEVGKVLGPGSLESVYEKALSLDLARRRLSRAFFAFFGSFASIRVHLRQKRRYRVGPMVGTTHPLVG